jgi:MFS family permease
LTFGHWVRPWHIVLLALLLGAGNAFDAPARQAFVLEMVDRPALGNAIALNSAMFNTATAVGPAASGIIYALLGPAWCFTVNGISFLAVIAALLMMRIDSRPTHRSSRTRVIDELKEGILYVRSHAMIRTLITMVLITALFGLSFATLIPAWAVETLRGNAATNGWLQSARGIGALISALLIASLGRFNFRGRLLTVGSFAFPIMLAAFSFIRWLPLSLVLILGIGMSSILIFNLCNSLVQTLVQDSLRGRVMGIYSLTFFGIMPIGAILVGLSAQLLGEPSAFLINAAIMMAFSLLIWMMAPKLRRLE